MVDVEDVAMQIAKRFGYKTIIRYSLESLIDTAANKLRTDEDFEELLIRDIEDLLWYIREHQKKENGE